MTSTNFVSPIQSGFNKGMIDFEISYPAPAITAAILQQITGLSNINIMFTPIDALGVIMFFVLRPLFTP